MPRRVSCHRRSRFVDLAPTPAGHISAGDRPRIDYDQAQIESIRQALEDHPAVFLWSTPVHLDGVIVPVALQENKLPPAHTFAGINLSFGFMGPLMRRSGVIFLRRKLDDPLYKYVLRQFVGYIVQKRFNLSWSIEGTRSRTGKMLPWLRSARLRGRRLSRRTQRGYPPAADVGQLDQLHETAEYAACARGEKIPEGAQWLINFVKAGASATTARSVRPVPLKRCRCQYLGDPSGPDRPGRGRQTAGTAEDGHRVAWRIQPGDPPTEPAWSQPFCYFPQRALTQSQLRPTRRRTPGLPAAQKTPMTKQRLAASLDRRVRGAGRPVQRSR